MSSGVAPTDAADEAGGEAVFSSDGLPPLPAPRAPVVSVRTEKQGDDVLDSGDGVDPNEAFEVFSGKLYAPSTTTSRSFRVGDETPLQRLARLKREVAEVEQDLQSEAAALPVDLTNVASELSSRLEAASSNNALQQDRLTAVLQKQVEGWKEAQKSKGSSGEVEQTVSGVMYELYGTPSDGPATSKVEERIVKLEKLLGSSSDPKTLLQRLDELEQTVKRVDSKALEEAATRAKVIRADLEAASKARSKLANTGSSAQDAKKITELHDHMMQLEGLTDHLPALVDRLQQLATLHKQTGSFSSRLTAAEQSLSSTQQTLTSLEETLTKVESGMGNNLTVMEQNMLQLDERMKKLSS